jgi:flagellar operon protein
MSAAPHNPALVPPGVIAPTPLDIAAQNANANPKAQALQGPAFGDVLAEKTAQVQFSGHALQRVRRRGIEVDAGTLQRLQNGVDRAAGKGARESVVFVDSTAFVVSVRNRTVITAVDRDHMKDHVFTNIDSAVIA